MRNLKTLCYVNRVVCKYLTEAVETLIKLAKIVIFFSLAKFCQMAVVLTT